MSDDINLYHSVRKCEAWECTREMSYEVVTELMGITQNTLDGYLEESWEQYVVKGYDFLARGAQ